MKTLLIAAFILLCVSAAYADPNGDPNWSVYTDDVGSTTCFLYGWFMSWKPGTGICLQDGTTLYSAICSQIAPGSYENIRAGTSTVSLSCSGTAANAAQLNGQSASYYVNSPSNPTNPVYLSATTYLKNVDSQVFLYINNVLITTWTQINTSGYVNYQGQSVRFMGQQVFYP